MSRRKTSFSPARHRGQTQVRLIVAGFSILAVVGGGLVWLIYGQAEAITAILCLVAAGGAFGLLWLFLSLLERWVKDDDA